MMNYFNIVIEKLADWFMEFFYDPEYVMQTAGITVNAPSATTESGTLSEQLFCVNINLSEVKSWYADIVETADKAGSVIAAALLPLLNMIKENRPDILTLSGKLENAGQKVTLVKQTGIQKLKAGKLFFKEKADTITRKYTDVLTLFTGLIQDGITNTGACFTLPGLRNTILESHST